MARKRKNPDEWSTVWGVVTELAREFNNDIIFIGGIAAYVYTARTPYPEKTHDADAAADHAAMRDLKQLYSVTTNKRLHKAEALVDGVEVDLYVGRESRLRYSYPELAMYRRWLTPVPGDGHIPVASIAHLICLKLDALDDRWATVKGEKDERDIARLLVLAHDKQEERDLLLGLTTEDDVDWLKRVVSADVFMEITRDNAKEASMLRKKAADVVRGLKR